jgi:hypothetical protein
MSSFRAVSELAAAEAEESYKERQQASVMLCYGAPSRGGGVVQGAAAGDIYIYI